MLRSPFLSQLEDAQSILIAGAGGGFDVFGGLPLYFSLRSHKKQVHLASLSFTALSDVIGRRPNDHLVEVTADSEGPGWYFPERYLCEWFRESAGDEVVVHCLERTGVNPLIASYEYLVKKLSLDTVVLVDGGTDSLMRGDEDGLGTPMEDIASIAAVSKLAVPRRFMACLGFGVDHFHGVSNDLSLEAISELTLKGGFLGAVSLLQSMPEAEKFREAATYVFSRMPSSISVVVSSILSSLSGFYGDHHATDRTKGSRLWINPLMSMYWCFDLTAVAERIIYLDSLMATETRQDVWEAILRFETVVRAHVRTRRPIPS